jgi:phosphoglycolate phosphatase-like HAD superfamily hydrolase
MTRSSFPVGAVGALSLLSPLACAGPSDAPESGAPPESGTTTEVRPAEEVLASWADGPARDRIIEFVTAVSREGGTDFVPRKERIVVFDNDGTLWSEKPVYFQLMYALDRVRERAADDPSILESDVLRAAAEGDLEAVVAAGHEGLKEIIAASHSEVTVDEFHASVRDWLDSARHPDTGLRYDRMVFQPMLELLDYLRAHGFRTYITSGGGLHFIRAFAEDAYGIPPEQVIGSVGRTSYQVVDGVPSLRKDVGIAFVDDGPGKPVAIDARLGTRPLMAVGNSDGDFAMLEWITAGAGPRMGILLHHTDADREWAYDRDSPVGGLDRGLDEAEARGWLLVDMARDWSRVYPDGGG